MFGRRRPRKGSDASKRCSFCGKAEGEVERLISGPGVCICNECVDLCADIIANGQAPSP